MLDAARIQDLLDVAKHVEQDFLHLLVARFELLSRSSLASLDEHLRTSAIEQCIEVAHALKGAAGFIGAAEVAALASELEDATSQDYADLGASVQALQTAITHALPALRASLLQPDSRANALGTKEPSETESTAVVPPRGTNEPA